MAEQLTIEKATKQLDDIIEKLENSEFSFEENIKNYEKAGELLEFCYKQLDDCELRITNVNERLDALEKSGGLSDE